MSETPERDAPAPRDLIGGEHARSLDDFGSTTGSTMTDHTTLEPMNPYLVASGLLGWVSVGGGVLLLLINSSRSGSEVAAAWGSTLLTAGSTVLAGWFIAAAVGWQQRRSTQRLIDSAKGDESV